MLHTVHAQRVVRNASRAEEGRLPIMIRNVSILVASSSRDQFYSFKKFSRALISRINSCCRVSIEERICPGGAAGAINIKVLLPRTSHGALQPQIICCGRHLLPRRTLERVSMAERKQSLQRNVVRANFGPDYDSDSGGGRSMVDANMLFLRKRINNLKLQEERENRRFHEEGELESEWMDWEKELYPVYHSRICQWVGLLHKYLIYTRPTVALATLSAMDRVVTNVNSIHLGRFGA